MIKTRDEILLLNQACAMVDAAYEELYRAMRPGMRENECVGLVNKVLYDMGSEFVEGVNAISGERCNPHPHVYTDRALRPGDPAYFDILHSYMGYRTCYYRTFAVASGSKALVDAYKRCRYYLDAAIALIKPGATTGEVASVWPKAQEFGFADEEAAFALQFGHGVGLSIWEKPIFSRLVSLEHPEEIKEGMVFALETFWPASDGWSAARIEEQLVVTADGCEVITRFPAEDLVIAGKPYYTVGGSLPLEREVTSERNTVLDHGAQEAAPANGNPAQSVSGAQNLPAPDSLKGIRLRPAPSELEPFGAEFTSGESGPVRQWSSEVPEPKRPPQLLGGERRIGRGSTQRVGHRVGDRRRRPDRAALADPLGAQRVVGRGRLHERR